MPDAPTADREWTVESHPEVARQKSVRLQIWSAHFEPQRSGIGPLVGTAARALHDRGVRTSVVAAHPFYPEPLWGRSVKPSRRVEAGIEVTRLPIYSGRASVSRRLVQEASYAASLTVATPLLRRPDAIVAVSPMFLALAPAMAAARVRAIPWILWLQDILPDAAVATAMVGEDGLSLRAARRLESWFYRSASRIIVIADSFVENLLAKGVDAAKIIRIYNPATEPLRSQGSGQLGDGRTVVTMGNVGFSQNLKAVVSAFEASSELERIGGRLVLAGDGAAGGEVRSVISTDRVRLTGFLEWAQLEAELQPASLALVSQKYPREGLDFNVPSKLMNFMARGLPVVAAVRRNSEVATIIERSGAGWIVDADRLDLMGATIAAALADPAERLRRGQAGRRFAADNFDPAAVAGAIEGQVRTVVARGRAGVR